MLHAGPDAGPPLRFQCETHAPGLQNFSHESEYSLLTGKAIGEVGKNSLPARLGRKEGEVLKDLRLLSMI